MDDTSPFRKKWLFIIFWLAILLAFYVLQIYRMGGFVVNEVRIFVEIICIIPPFLLLWMAFFSQFVLPVNTFKERQKIFDRLFQYLTGMHGPAIFIRDGEPVKGDQEERKRGPGVLWLDSASGVVTRTDTEFKNSFGPGVHFTEMNERIADTVDLHIQNHNIGPNENDKPFEKKKEEQSEEEKAAYEAVQGRRNRTSALTRDGIEIVPNINVTFKIDADPIQDPNLPGSRFGFQEESVRQAIIGQAINPSLSKDSNRFHVPWNLLPALLAADIWRDLVGKFTLNDLFEKKFTLPPSIPNPPRQDITDNPIDNPIKPQNRLADFITSLLKELNQRISQTADWIEKYCNPETKVKQEKVSKKEKKETPKEEKLTGLQIINFLLKERLQKQKIATLDRYGNHQPGQNDESREHDILQQRGISVLSASINSLRLPPEVDEKLLKQWTANWLRNAREEHNQLDQEEGYRRVENEENSLRNYIDRLSEDLLRQVENNRATNLRDTLRALLLESRVELVNETQAFRQSSPEREGLEEIIQWLESRDL
jgi:hypothetical protein